MSNTIKSFKSQTAKTAGENENDGDVHPERRFPFVGIGLYSGKKFGAATSIVDGSLFEAVPLELVKSVLPTSSADARVNIDADRQEKILSKVKLVKKTIAKLFRPTSHFPVAVSCVDRSLVPSNDAEPVATYHEKVADQHMGGLASTFRGIDESSSSSANWSSMATESQLDISHSTFDLGELSTIDEEDEDTREVVGAMNTHQEELANSCSGITIYLSIDTLFDHSMQDGSSLDGSEPRRSPGGTSLATSVDREDGYQFLLGASHRLRRVPSYEDLRIIGSHDFSCSAVLCGPSDCDSPASSFSGVNVAPLRRSFKCDNLRASLLSLEPKSPLPCRTRKYKKLLVWSSNRCDESSKEETSASLSPRNQLRLSLGRQFLQDIFHPSSHVQAHVP